MTTIPLRRKLRLDYVWRWAKGTVMAAGLTGMLVAGLGWAGEAGWLGRAKMTLSPATIRTDGGKGFAVSAVVGSWDGPGGHHRSDTVLLEEQRPLGPPHALHAEIREQGGGRFSHWNGQLYFSTSDNSDPRTNGRQYVLVSTRRFPQALTAGGVIIALGSLSIWLGVVVLRRWPLSSLVPVVKRRQIVEGLVVGLFAAGPSLFWLATLPPTWNYNDSVVVSLFEMSPTVVPHYPPLYPIFTRAINFLLTHAFVPEAPTIAGLGGGNLSDVSLYGLIFVQHVVLAAAIAYFAYAAGQSFSRRLLAVIPFYLVPALSLYNHGVFTEGLWTSVLIVMLAAMINLLRGQQANPLHYFIYFAALVAGMLTRHVTFVFAAMLPGTLLVLACMELAVWRNHVRRAGAAIAVSALAYLSVKLVYLLVCPLLGTDNRPVVGRVLVYHVCGVDWASVPAVERAQLVTEIEKKCSSPEVTGAVSVIFSSRGPWLGSWNAVHNYLRGLPAAATDGVDLAPLTDQVLTEVTKRYVATFNRWYLERVRVTLNDYWKLFRDGRQSDEVLTNSAQSMELYPRVYPEYFPGVATVAPAQVIKYEAMKTHWLYRMATWWTDARLTILLGGLLTVKLLRGLERRYLLFCVVAAVNLIIYFFLMSYITIMVPRYGLVTSIVVAVLLGLVLATSPRQRQPPGVRSAK